MFSFLFFSLALPFLPLLSFFSSNLPLFYRFFRSFSFLSLNFSFPPLLCSLTLPLVSCFLLRSFFYHFSLSFFYRILPSCLSSITSFPIFSLLSTLPFLFLSLPFLPWVLPSSLLPILHQFLSSSLPCKLYIHPFPRHASFLFQFFLFKPFFLTISLSSFPSLFHFFCPSSSLFFLFFVFFPSYCSYSSPISCPPFLPPFFCPTFSLPSNT